MKDFFRPNSELARTLYDAFQEEASKREGCKTQNQKFAEEVAVWEAARDYAQQHGEFRVVFLSEVVQAGNLAEGHVDFGAKWAYGVAAAMRRPFKTIQS